jgi:hypothetical protein
LMLISTISLVVRGPSIPLPQWGRGQGEGAMKVEGAMEIEGAVHAPDGFA